ncbi:MAG: hypothetical protein M1548_01320 [Actinobacteria bacterium]|nr:hypothetical protein [Actinomycetota bacterium]
MFRFYSKGVEREGEVGRLILALSLLFVAFTSGKLERRIRTEESFKTAVVNIKAVESQKLTEAAYSALKLSSQSKEVAIGPSGVPSPEGAKVLGRGEWSAVASFRYVAKETPGEIGAYYLDRLGEDWILIDSNALTSSAQGWTGRFMSADFTKNLYIFALPEEISPFGDRTGPTRVSIMVVPRKGGG